MIYIIRGFWPQQNFGGETVSRLKGRVGPGSALTSSESSKHFKHLKYPKYMKHLKHLKHLKHHLKGRIRQGSP